MVKADSKHDYYADLELPATADAETIKRQFRLLAKQYHPDRNPGKEMEVIAKFQAIQAANEILSDPTQKADYDRDRAQKAHASDAAGTYMYKKPARPPPPPSPFPPPPKRDPNLNKPSYGAKNTRPTSSASAEKFARFARAAPQQQWDRAKFEDAAKEETLRNLHTMRGQAQGPPPRVPPRAAPTAPRPPSAAPSPDPGFPGLSRTSSGRRNAGFSPGTPGTDESPAPSSAYAHVHRPPPPATGFSYPPNASKAGTPTSPPVSRTRPSMSPLRASRSSGFEDVQRPNLSRTSSRYAKNPGERTDINGGLGRSASVRNSPTAQHWDESGPFGRRPQSSQYAGFKSPPPPRHRSSSPKVRTDSAQYSASETSSSDADEPSQPQRNEARPKMTPRKSQPSSSRNPTSPATNDPTFTGQNRFGNHSSRIDDKQYHYPPPESNDTVADHSNPVDEITQGLNRSGIRHVHRDDVPHNNQNFPKPNGTSSEPQTTGTAPNTSAPFSAADWDGKFANGDAFRPTEPSSRSRSPTKTPRPKLPNRDRGMNRSQGDKESDGSANEDRPPNMPGVRHVSGASEAASKAAAFQAGKFSAEDWAQRLRSQSNSVPPKVPPRDRPAPTKISTKQPSVHEEVEVEEQPSSPEEPAPHRTPVTGPDPMEIDESLPQQVLPVNNNAPKRPQSETAFRQPSSNGIDLGDLRDTVPFKPSATGLADLDDLGNSLPFESRAAEELNLRQAPSSGLAAHHLGLPQPPKTILSPDEAHLDQVTWSAYAAKMTKYMDDWNIFNCKMIDHFRVRQQQIHLSMYHNWITAIGDGAASADFNGLDFVGSEAGIPDPHDAARSKSKKAGYSTYMEWLREDGICRTWWEVAFEEHTKCMEDLGRVRKLVKTIFMRESKKTG